MTEIVPIDNARALTWNGRRACTAQSLTAVEHLDITLVSPTLSQCVTNKRIFFIYVIADSRTGVKESCQKGNCVRTGVYQRETDIKATRLTEMHHHFIA